MQFPTHPSLTKCCTLGHNILCAPLPLWVNAPDVTAILPNLVLSMIHHVITYLATTYYNCKLATIQLQVYY